MSESIERAHTLWLLGFAVMGIGRWAGDALRGYEDAWSQAVTAGLRPIDRMLASDEDRLSGVARGLAPEFERVARDHGGTSLRDFDGSAYSGFGDGLNKIDPSGALYAAYDRPIRPHTEEDQYPPSMYHAIYEASRDIAARGEGAMDSLLAASVMQAAQKHGYDKQALRKLVDEGGVPESFMMTRGMASARHVLAHRGAAYGLPAVGVGLGAWGAHDLLMAQQQAEKDSQLPLSGGQQL